MKQTDVIRRKLTNLAEYATELEPFKSYTIEQYVSNYFIKRTGERLVQLIVENMVDINSLLIVEQNHVPPKDYYTSFTILSELNILPRDFAEELAPCTGMRNRIVHEYDKIEDQIVFDSIPKLLEMVVEYTGIINKLLK
jgi:uncharacterized protein YutE (UPF0331/DUF86 family)